MIITEVADKSVKEDDTEIFSEHESNSEYSISHDDGENICSETMTSQRVCRVSVTHSENKTWYLHIRDVQEYDRGWYMCQINTDPMKSQVGYLDVVVSPDILDYPTSADIVVQEGTNVTLRCEAKGYPRPHILWRREGGEHFHLKHGQMGSSAYGPILNINQVSRQDMGPYLCIAFNGIPPSVSKRIMLIVNFPPNIQVDKQLLSAYDGYTVMLECHSEAHPKSINYWIKNNGEIVPENEKFHIECYESDNYKVHMKLTIKNTSEADYGSYQCISKNIIGEAEETIQLYSEGVALRVYALNVAVANSRYLETHDGRPIVPSACAGSRHVITRNLYKVTIDCIVVKVLLCNLVGLGYFGVCLNNLL
ncbi:hypothetical protein FQA39_LY04199 [Lamprigera yunnana]|nr:hypothetical protein FQA39_LY04199 [Lamprigera yunnana]